MRERRSQGPSGGHEPRLDRAPWKGQGLSVGCISYACIVVAMLLLGCRTTPITGRRQLLILPETQEINLGLSSYQQTLSTEKLSKNEAWAEVVRRVGTRIAEVAERPDYDWEFQLVDSPEMNAFALPGGKVAVYEGILPICQTEAGLAVVMSHEIAHALARHGGERLSQQYMVTGLGKLVDMVAMKRTDIARQRINQAFGVISEYGVVLPYSRKHESEADHMGIMLMARAGYDPREAPRFWMRFGEAQANGDRPIEFLSTHPADHTRAADLAALLPEAMSIYEQALAQTDSLYDASQVEHLRRAGPGQREQIDGD